jgi:hypothetical protein
MRLIGGRWSGDLVPMRVMGVISTAELVPMRVLGVISTGDLVASVVIRGISPPEPARSTQWARQRREPPADVDRRSSSSR